MPEGRHTSRLFLVFAAGVFAAWTGLIATFVIARPNASIYETGRDATANEVGAGRTFALRVGPAGPRLADPTRYAVAAPTITHMRLNSVSGRALYGGRAPAGKRVALVLGDRIIASTRADPRGAWQIASVGRIGQGLHEFTVEQSGPDGRNVVVGETIRVHVPAGYRQTIDFTADGAQAGFQLAAVRADSADAQPNQATGVQPVLRPIGSRVIRLAANDTGGPPWDWLLDANRNYQSEIVERLKRGGGYDSLKEDRPRRRVERRERVPARTVPWPFAGETGAGMVGLERWFDAAQKSYATEIVPRLSGELPPTIVARRRVVDEVDTRESEAERRRREEQERQMRDEAAERAEQERLNAERRRREAEERRRAAEAEAARIAEEQRVARERAAAEARLEAERRRAEAERNRELELARAREEAEREERERAQLAALERARREAEARRQREEAGRRTIDTRREEQQEEAERQRLARLLTEKIRLQELERQRAESARREAERLEAARREAERERAAELARERAEEERRRREAAAEEERRRRRLAAERLREIGEQRRRERAEAEERRRLALLERERAAREAADRQRVVVPELPAKSTVKVAAKSDQTSVRRQRSPATRVAAVKKTVKRRRTAVRSYRRRSSRRSSNRCSRRAGRRINPPGTYVVKRGDSLWRISRRHYRRGIHFRKIYRANRRKIRRPRLIYPCQRFHLPRHARR